jgi:hypothetical protein
MVIIYHSLRSILVVAELCTKSVTTNMEWREKSVYIIDVHLSLNYAFSFLVLNKLMKRFLVAYIASTQLAFLAMSWLFVVLLAPTFSCLLPHILVELSFFKIAVTTQCSQVTIVVLAGKG